MKWFLLLVLAALCVTFARPVASLTENDPSPSCETVSLDGVTLEYGCPSCNGGDRVVSLIPPKVLCVNCPPGREGDRCEKCKLFYGPPGDCSQVLVDPSVLETVSKTYGGLTDQVNENTNTLKVLGTRFSVPQPDLSPATNYTVFDLDPELAKSGPIRFVELDIWARASVDMSHDPRWCTFTFTFHGVTDKSVTIYRGFATGGKYQNGNEHLTEHFTRVVPVDPDTLELSWDVVRQGCSSLETEVSILGARC